MKSPIEKLREIRKYAGANHAIMTVKRPLIGRVEEGAKLLKTCSSKKIREEKLREIAA